MFYSKKVYIVVRKQSSMGKNDEMKIPIGQVEELISAVILISSLESKYTPLFLEDWDTCKGEKIKCLEKDLLKMEPTGLYAQGCLFFSAYLTLKSAVGQGIELPENLDEKAEKIYRFYNDYMHKNGLYEKIKTKKLKKSKKRR